MSDPLHDLARISGIHEDFWDLSGRRIETAPDTARALLAAMGRPAGTDAEAAATLAAVQAEAAARPLPWWLVLEPDTPSHHTLPRTVASMRLIHEDGTEIALAPGAEIGLPALPLGIHILVVDGHQTTLLVAPARLPLPERDWGVTLPLYGLRTADEGGIGDYRDLAVAAAGLGAAGAAFVGLNPVHAGFPADPNAFSPYSPSHRRRLSTSHIAVPGFRLKSSGALIDYPATLAHQREALETVFDLAEADGPDPAFETFLETGGASLLRFATHQALSDIDGSYWCHWPAAYQNAASAEVAKFRAANPRQIRFHAWLQYLADRQLLAAAEAAKAAGMRFGLYLDLAVGTHPHGAETWSEPEVFAKGVSLGAPPDAFSPDGQVWALSPFNPHALARMNFRPLAETLRRQLRYAGLLRIDHVLGFERAFWAPDDRSIPGTYVAMPRDAMLAVVRIEAARAGASVIGEDLGNIPEGLQGALEDAGIMGCRVAMFEQQGHGSFRPPEEYTEIALASFSTHDLPTWAGWREGRDIEARHRIGILDDAEAESAQDWRRDEVAGFDALAGSNGDGPDPMHRFLGRTKSRLVALQIEDLLGLADQANLPGTIDSYPNWRRRLPVTAEALAGLPELAHAAKIMKETGRKTGRQE
ncbi:4-alpha-glucanotransferase [Tropicimonas sp. IMCC34043]|uniref:4-alpha-glucanotransferase n=1 Tax=Tropicimonas sp. IMCC34043 TaxID=2248760 RepID=UPI000E22936F|nr:4-alpha-glucanotransferase [Tropicimonas sp. IMCC34043]